MLIFPCAVVIEEPRTHCEAYGDGPAALAVMESGSVMGTLAYVGMKVYECKSLGVTKKHWGF